MEELVFEEDVGPPSAFHITLGDVLVFVNWMDQMEKSLARAEALPPLPDVKSGKVRGWVHLIRRLGEGVCGNEETKRALEATTIAHEAQIGQLFSHMHTNIASLYDNLG
jgi:hypothetical protein